MKTFCLFVLFEILCASGDAAGLPLANLGNPFQAGPEAEIVWGVRSNTLPKTLWIYRVLSQDFPPSVRSNMIALGSFTSADKKAISNPAFNKADAVLFSKEGRELGIFPHLGFITYLDSKAVTIESVEGVPKDDDETFRLGTNYLFKLGIPRSQLSKKPQSSELRTYFSLNENTVYKGTNGPVTNVTSRGVSFIRSLDKVDFIGTGARGGCSIEFGNHGKVSRIKVSWRKLKKDAEKPVAKTDDFIASLRAGNCVLAPGQMLERIDWKKAKMTIQSVTPYYYGDVENADQDWVYPFGELRLLLETRTTNTTIFLRCPILSGSAERNRK